MVVILINPNSTEAMTLGALETARAAAPEIAFEGWTSRDGPPAIQGPEDGDRAVPPLLELVRRASDSGADAIIIACFDDTGLTEARRLANCPVIGIGQASFILASLMPGRTAVVTTVPEAVPVIEANIAGLGLSQAIAGVVAADVPVLTLEHDPADAAARFHAVSETLPPEVTNIILGCAGAVTIMGILRQSLPHTLMDGVTAAARLCRAVLPAD